MNEFPNYEEWERLKPEQKDYLLWQTLNKVNGYPKRFAARWVETGLITVISIVVVYLVNGILNSTFDIK